jgi:hypothetical protein
MNDNKELPSNKIHLGQTVRNACIQAARESFRDASMSGLCREGAIEAAIGAMQSLDVEKLVGQAAQGNR